MSNSETGLTILGQSNTEMTTGGLGRTGTSKLLQVTAASLGIVQPSSTKENGKKGYFIIDGDDSLQFKELIVTLLTEPEEQRAYYTGNPGEMNRTPENLACFSRDMIRPDAKAKYPQAPNCSNCPRGSWETFRKKKDKGIPTTKEDIPPCDAFYLATLLDTQYKMPMKLYVRSQSKEPFEKGMKSIARKLAMIGAASGRVPNIFDVSFKLSTKLVTKGRFSFYILQISEVESTTEEQREAFGIVFKQYEASQKSRYNREDDAEVLALAEVEAASESIDKAATGSTVYAEYVDEEIPF